MSAYHARSASNNTCVKKQDAFDLSMFAPPTSPTPQDDDDSIHGMRNYAIGPRIQRSMSAPPMAENVGRLPPPMYAQSEYAESPAVRPTRWMLFELMEQFVLQDASMSPPEYYYYYAPKSHNPRLPISYNNWEAMQRQHYARHTTSTLHRVQISERRRGGSEESTDSQARLSSNKDFEAAVAAAGGHSLHHFVSNQDAEHHHAHCLSPTDSSDSNSSSSVRPVNKTLIDRIQEDFPRTPSPVFGYTPATLEVSQGTIFPDLGGIPDVKELPPDFLQNMKRLNLSHGRDNGSHFSSKTRSNSFLFPPGSMLPPPGMMPHPHHSQYPMYFGRYPRGGGVPFMEHHMSHRQYMDSYDAQIGDPSSRPDIRLLPLPHNYDYDKPLYTGCYIAPSQHEARLYHQRGAAAWDAVQEACDNSTSDHHVEPEGFAPHYQRNHIQVQPSVMRAKAKTCPGISVPQQGAPQHSQQRSVLLEDFDFRTMTTSKPSKWELVDARGHIVEFSKDQHGSRFIQLKLETAKPDIKDIVFSEVAPVALQLMTDVFGNYVIQKFFDHGNPQHITQLMRVIQGHMLDLALHMYGCRVIQKALESTDDLDLKLDLICELQGHVLHCIKDQNGNHVIQKCIEILPWKVPSVVEDMSRASFLLESFENNVDTMSTHPYGCRVIQRVLEKCSDEQMAPILREIQDSYGLLVNDQYGNYVIQHVLQHGPPSQRTALINRIYPDIIRFSYHKFSSNVIEKCLSYASVKQLRVIMHHILNSSDNGECPLQIMMKDQYANYVVQKLIDVADSTERDKMAAIIKSHAANLKRYTHGKHILNRLEKLTGQKII